MKLERVIDLLATKTYNDKELEVYRKAEILNELATAKSKIPCEVENEVIDQPKESKKRFAEFKIQGNDKVTLDIYEITSLHLGDYWDVESNGRKPCVEVVCSGPAWFLIDYPTVASFMEEFFE